MPVASFLRRLGFCFICALLTPAAYAQFSVLYTYGLHANDPVDPHPNTKIAQGRDGNLYSTAFQGGANNGGAAFAITPGGSLGVLYSFCSQPSCADGAHPEGGLTLGTDGNLYGTTSGGGNTDNAYGDGVVFKMTSAGVPTVLHAFDNPTKGEGYYPYGAPVEGLDGNFYGTTSGGGAGGCGTIYKVTPDGITFTILHTFTNQSTDACSPRASLVLGTDGNLYGMASYGAYTTFKITPAGKYTHLTPNSALGGGFGPLLLAPNGSFYGSNANQIFKMSASGAVTILHASSGSTDPNGYGYNGVAWASDGNLYGDTQTGGTTTNCSSNLGYCGVLFKMTTAGAYTNLHNFENPDGYEGVPVIQHTNGIIYGQADFGGSIPPNAGTFWSWNTSLKPFVSFMPFTGHVGDQIQIFGQGFTSSSVVKFNGVVASHTLTGSTFITATVPQGTLNGYITVTTGGTTLKSLYKFLVHDSWGGGTAMTKPVAFAAAAAVSGKIYVVGGYPGTTYSGPVGDTQIYNPTTNKWSSGTALSIGTAQAAAAVVNGIVYVFGGTTDGSTDTNAVWAYNPATNSWSPKTAMPTARRSISAAVYKNIIYVIGGFSVSGGRLSTVESYNPATDSWTEQAPLLLGKSEPSVGTVGTKIIAADGYDGTSDNGDNESYTVSLNKWTSLKADPKPSNGGCFGAVGTLMYVAGGGNGPVPQASSTTLESYSLSGNSWTTLSPLPQGSTAPASAVNGGLLYCIGGWASSPSGAVLGNVQIYQP